jgi:hypothetical protein
VNLPAALSPPAAPAVDALSVEDLVDFARRHHDGTAPSRGCDCLVCRGFRAECAAHARTKSRALDLSETARGRLLALQRLVPARGALGALWRVQGYARTYYAEEIVREEAVEIARDAMFKRFEAVEGASVLVSHVLLTGQVTVTRYRVEHGQWQADVLKHWTGGAR